MSTDQGYILVPRGHRDHPLLQEPDKLGAWLWLMFAAAHTAYDLPAVNRPSGEMVRLEPGQLTYSIRFLERAWGWSDRKVRRFLTALEQAGLVILATTGGDRPTTTGSTPGQTLITICNWEAIQRRNLSATTGSTTPTTTGSTTNKKQLKQLEKKEALSEGFEGEESKRSSNEEYTEGFLAFWEPYPRTEKKKDAARAYAKVLKEGLISEPDLLAKLKAWIANWSAVPEGKRPFAPHAATWLNGRRWEEVSNAKASEPLSADRLTDEQWQLYVKLSRQGLNQWPDELGPKPGKPGCRVPPHLLIAPVQEVGLRPAATPVQPVRSAT